VLKDVFIWLSHLHFVRLHHLETHNKQFFNRSIFVKESVVISVTGIYASGNIMVNYELSPLRKPGTVVNYPGHSSYPK